MTSRPLFKTKIVVTPLPVALGSWSVAQFRRSTRSHPVVRFLLRNWLLPQRGRPPSRTFFKYEFQATIMCLRHCKHQYDMLPTYVKQDIKKFLSGGDPLLISNWYIKQIQSKPTYFEWHRWGHCPIRLPFRRIYANPRKRLFVKPIMPWSSIKQAFYFTWLFWLGHLAKMGVVTDILFE